MISFHDKQVGRLMALLKELDLEDNTVVLYTSDNGTTHVKEQVDYEFFESVGQLRGLKGSVYEGGLRVPMIARWPGRIQKGALSDHLSAHYDLISTIADLADTAAPESDSLSMLPALLGEENAQKKHDHLFWDFAGLWGTACRASGRLEGCQAKPQERRKRALGALQHQARSERIQRPLPATPRNRRRDGPTDARCENAA